MKRKKTFYYSDVLNDDFAGVKKAPFTISEDYKYVPKNKLWLFLAFVAHRVIMTPIAFFYTKLKFHTKYENKEVLKGVKSYCLFGNHTQIPGDAYFPNMITFPKKPYFIVHSDNVSTFGTRNFMKMVGALPVPDTLNGTKNLNQAIKHYLEKGNPIVIFPEAHIWPYYTDIRPFKSTSFYYPIKNNVPSFSMTTTYQKRKRGKTRITVYIDGPFLPKEELKGKEKEVDLRNQVYDAMKKRSLSNEVEVISYIRSGEND